MEKVEEKFKNKKHRKNDKRKIKGNKNEEEFLKQGSGKEKEENQMEPKRKRN